MTRFLLTLCLLLCTLRCCASPNRYRITPLPGMNIWNGNAFLNSKGMVACGDKVRQNGKMWTIHNPLHDPRYTETDASGINRMGVVIGTFNGTPEGAWAASYARVFKWQMGRVTLLPPTDTSYLSVPAAEGINNTGDVLVNVTIQSPLPDDEITQSFIYHIGRYHQLPKSNMLRINSMGRFVIVHYPTSVGPLSGEVYEMHGINSTGLIAGQYQTRLNSLYVIRACIWRKSKCYDIGPQSGEASNAFAINNRGQVVGEFDTGREDKQRNNITRAFVWQNGRMTDLNRLIPARSGWVLTEADAINDRGQIVCAGSKGACLLTPIANKRRRL